MSEQSEGTGGDLERELAALRAENARLHAQLDRRSGQPGVRRRVSVLLAVVVAILVPVSLVTVWADRTVFSTDAYVETVGPLAREEAVQRRVADVITEQVDAQVDFRALAEDLLPDDLQQLAGPIAGGARQIVARVVTELVRSELFVELWSTANRLGHQTVLAALTGEGSDLVASEDGRLAIGLAPVLERVGEAVSGVLSPELVAGLGLDEIEAEYVVLESEDLARAQDALDLLDTLGWLVPVVTLVLAALVILVAADRRRAVRRLGLALVLSTLVTVALVAVLRNRVLDAAVDQEAAAVTYDTLLRFLHRALRAVLVLGVVVLIGAWLVGPGGSAQRVRAWWADLVGRAGDLRDPDTTGPVPVWVAGHRSALQVVAVAVAGLAVVLWDRPTGWVIVVIALLLLVALGAIGVLARIGERAAPPPDETGGSSTTSAAGVGQAAQSAQQP